MHVKTAVTVRKRTMKKKMIRSGPSSIDGTKAISHGLYTTRKEKCGPEMNPSGPVPAWAWPTCLLHLVQNGDLKLGTNLPARSNSKA